MVTFVLRKSHLGSPVETGLDGTRVYIQGEQKRAALGSGPPWNLEF